MKDDFSNLAQGELMQYMTSSSESGEDDDLQEIEEIKNIEIESPSVKEHRQIKMNFGYSEIIKEVESESMQSKSEQTNLS